MILIRSCRREDLDEVAVIFRDSFPDSVDSLMPGQNPVPALVDIFYLLWQAVPQGFFVAEMEGKIVGYIVAPDQIRRIWWQALSRGAVFKWAVKFVLGKYNLPWRRLPRVLWNKLLFVGSEKSYSPPGSYGRVLSVAVSPDARGKGLSKLLVARAIQWLSEAGVGYVKLEVRPDNLPAVRAYASLGFEERGSTRDVQGEWRVFVLKL